ncbi:Uncharacterized membrane protein [Ruaniaceae bacterium KH17]|nr:Uncharacterized membrane protein [Ruaniaceae bacterium KH17]
MRSVLAWVTIPLVIATVIGMLLLWPRGETPVGQNERLANGYGLQSARVLSIEPVDETDELNAMIGNAVMVELLNGVGEGEEVPVHVPFEIVDNGLSVGDRIVVLFNPDALATGVPYTFWDFHRDVPMIALSIVYLLVVFAVARFKGLAAVGGLIACLGVIFAFILPAIMAGRSPLLVVMVGSGAMLLLAVYLAHGVSIRTTTAVLGTFAGVAVTVLLGAGALDWANLTGAQSEDALLTLSYFPGLNMRHLLLCGLVISALGALNDVTITQASAVWELHAANPSLSKARLFAGGMRIGRDHIASTIYTLAFAYVGGILGTLLVVMTFNSTVPEFLLLTEIAEEIVRTLVASIGLILAIPFTTALAAGLVPVSGARSAEVTG